ncbi:Autophagy-related protein 3, N-terminal, partial [Sesbania bispinosa]
MVSLRSFTKLSKALWRGSQVLGPFLPSKKKEFSVSPSSLSPATTSESGEPSKRKPYLPPEKQFLITRNVPCLRRAASVEEEYEAAGGEVLLDDEDNDGWLATHGKPKGMCCYWTGV